MKKTICNGCGVTLQTTNENEKGFVVNLDQEYCRDCFTLLHYGQTKHHFHPEDLPTFPSDALILVVTSILHLDMLFSYPIYRYGENLKYVYIINQIDLLPKDTNLDFFLNEIIKKAKKENIPYEDIILMSALNKNDINNLKTYLEKFNKKYIYLIGVQNAGKTTIFKSLTDDDKALAMKKAGLTQNPLMKPFNKSFLYDMPGLYQTGYLHEFIPYEVYKKMIPDKRIKPLIFQAKPHSTYIISDYIGIKVKEETSLIFYVNTFINIKRVNTKKYDEIIKQKNDYENKAFKIAAGKQQITLADFGFLHLSGPNNLIISAPKKLHLTISKALFK